MKPVNVITEDVSEELKIISKKNSIPEFKLYVAINSVQTFIKVGKSSFEEATEEKIELYRQEKYLRDESVEFAQEYDIDILQLKAGHPFSLLKCEIEFEQNDSLAYLVIKKGSRLNYYERLYSEFLAFIDDLKLRNNIMFYIFDTDYKNVIKQFVEVLKKTNTVTFQEDKKILIAKGFDEIPSVNPEVYMTIEEKDSDKKDDSNKKVDHADRGFLLSCAEGDELFSFIKPVQGEHGRNIRGELIEVETVDLSARPTFTVEDSIEVQDSFENIKYLSKKSGYLLKKGDQFEVANTINLDEISFKTTGTINSDLDTEISINVFKENPLEDAIEEGMNVKVQNLSINGSVGPNTKIEARSVNVDGQTHDSSSIKCVKADISLHKGKVCGRGVYVKTLEGGEVLADNAHIHNAMRGKISAHNISVDILGSHITLKASDSIEINRIRGDENTFIIDESYTSVFDEQKEDDLEYVDKIKKELFELEKQFKNSSEKLKSNLESCNKVSAAILKAKKEGLKIADSLIRNFKACKILKVHYKTIKEKLDYKKEQYDKLQEKLKERKTIFEKFIILKEPLNGFNTIIYRPIKPKIEIKLKVDQSMTKNVFKLIMDDDGVYKIINTD